MFRCAAIVKVSTAPSSLGKGTENYACYVEQIDGIPKLQGGVSSSRKMGTDNGRLGLETDKDQSLKTRDFLSVFKMWAFTTSLSFYDLVAISVEPLKVQNWILPEMPGLITDFQISLDDQFPYFVNWLHGDIRQYNIEDPKNPVLKGQVRVEGLLWKGSSIVAIVEDGNTWQSEVPEVQHRGLARFGTIAAFHGCGNHTGTGFTEDVLEPRSKSLGSQVIPEPKLYYRYGDTMKPDVWLEASEEVKAADLTISPVAATTPIVGSHVWVEDSEVAWIDSEVLEINGEEVKVSCTSGKTVIIKVSYIYHKDTEVLPSGVDDMTKLAYLHKPGVLENLRSRYDINEIYSLAAKPSVEVDPLVSTD
ncbi:hypothetical protein HN51_018139 [Arachis hypogaea]